MRRAEKVFAGLSLALLVWSTLHAQDDYCLCWRKIPISNNVGGVKTFLSTRLLHPLRVERHFALVEICRNQPWARF
jgi:hypothetical protein